MKARPVGLIDSIPFETVGVAVFALTGALVAARKGMDPFGFALLATVTGVGGGTLRDLLIGTRPVFWVGDPGDVLVCLMVAGIVFALGPRRVAALDGGRRGRALLWADALGLALFAIGGTSKALAADVPALSAVALGTVTATFGGIIRDILAGTTPLVLRKEIYVTAAALGAGVMVGLRALGLDPFACSAAGFAAAFGLRALAILRGWSLPVFPQRDGNG
ncbi:trimeric intracellular cation channel family protein [Microvirga puerhi]|uniref:Trimeric intracellular cation channel family protein n=1 Tax=Microvirga puerhi TaxID=2876078 RepID=A0ABS7VP02_9HYPH|nr:trimeric intracellular cation channel family protein [Microvirga puerhi]MBZ6076722.1 trimeric intracellular cation channel family protein [Microvirga puerhi]